MAEVNAVIGVAQVVSNLRRRFRQLAAGNATGLKMAGLHLQRTSQRLVPVDYGFLKASAYTRHTGEGWNTVVTIGYTAAYALYVHENREIWPPGMRLKGQDRSKPHKGKYWDPQNRAQPKFLEDPARTEAGMIRAIIRYHTRIIR